MRQSWNLSPLKTHLHGPCTSSELHCPATLNHLSRFTCNRF
uniref:Uncharacterized protein n=1 Tax=Arundo donax TaxID=35708 RepID=A0A0A8Z7U1_ARUDO